MKKKINIVTITWIFFCVLVAAEMITFSMEDKIKAAGNSFTIDNSMKNTNENRTANISITSIGSYKN